MILLLVVLVLAVVLVAVAFLVVRARRAKPPEVSPYVERERIGW